MTRTGLIAEINLANARGGATLDLAKKCAYTLTADIDGAGLPAITTPITLNGGKDTTITCAAAAEPFRILNVNVNVNVNGRLTLNHLTITGGQPAPGGQGVGFLSTRAAAPQSTTVESSVIYRVTMVVELRVSVAASKSGTPLSVITPPLLQEVGSSALGNSWSTSPVSMPTPPRLPEALASVVY